MKYALITRADENIRKMSKITHPFMRKYAEKIGADFIIYDHEPPVWTKDKRPHYRILKAIDDFERYDRILFMDTDVAISKNCPNIFDEVPFDCIGTVFEDKGRRRAIRLSKIRGIQKAWGNIGWTEGYSNAGVLVASNIHKAMFDPYEDNKYWLDWGSVDLHMSYMARKHGFKFYELSYKWNHMTMFSEKWNGCADRFNSYIIHYAGQGLFDAKKRINQIERDVKTIGR